MMNYAEMKNTKARRKEIEARRVNAVEPEVEAQEGSPVKRKRGRPAKLKAVEPEVE